MYNADMFNKLEEKFGRQRMIDFAEIMAARHELLYLEHLNEGLEDFTEEDFERDWWDATYRELVESNRSDKIICEVIDKIKSRSAVGINKYGTTLDENNTDDFLKHLQEELMDAVNYVQKLMNTLKSRGYTNLNDVPNHNDFNDFSEKDLELE